MKKLLLLISVLISLQGCGLSKSKEEKVLLFAGYSAAREVFNKIIPEFEKEWLAQTGQKVVVKKYGRNKILISDWPVSPKARRDGPVRRRVRK